MNKPKFKIGTVLEIIIKEGDKPDCTELGAIKAITQTADGFIYVLDNDLQATENHVVNAFRKIETRISKKKNSIKKPKTIQESHQSPSVS